MQIDKSIKKIFSEICNGELTNLEIDDYINERFGKYNLPRLKRLIIDYEQFIIQERPEALLYFDYLYIVRKRFIFSDYLYFFELNELICRNLKHTFDYANDFTDLDHEKYTLDLKEFSPFLTFFSTERSDFASKLASLDAKYYPLLREYGSFEYFKPKSDIDPLQFSEGFNLNLFQREFYYRIKKDEDFIPYISPEFMKGIGPFINSHTFYFHLKLNILYEISSLQQTNKHSSTVSEPSVKDETNVSPKNADQSSETVADKPQEDLSPKGIAKSTNSHSYSKEQIEFVMSYAEKCRIYDFTSTIIKEIKEDPNFSKIFKNAPADTTLRRWLDKYDKKNKIKRQIDRVNIKRDTQKK